MSDQPKDLAERLVQLERDLQKAAETLEADAKIKIELKLWQHDLDTGLRAVSGTVYTLAWIVPLFGKTLISGSIALEPEFKQYLQIGRSTTLNGRLHIEPYIASTAHNYDQAMTLPLLDGVGIPTKEHTKDLEIKEISHDRSWKIALIESQEGKLSYVSRVQFVHNSSDHPEITNAVFTDLVELRKLRMRNYIKLENV